MNTPPSQPIIKRSVRSTLHPLPLPVSVFFFFFRVLCSITHNDRAIILSRLLDRAISTTAIKICLMDLTNCGTAAVATETCATTLVYAAELWERLSGVKTVSWTSQPPPKKQQQKTITNKQQTNTQKHTHTNKTTTKKPTTKNNKTNWEWCLKVHLHNP